MSIKETENLLESDENETSQNRIWTAARSKLEESSKLSALGAGMAGFFGVTELGPESESLTDMAPEIVSIGSHDFEIQAYLEEADDFFDESVWGKERNAENLLEEITLRSDKLGHYTVSYLGAGLGARAADKMTGEYDPKKVALGSMATVPIYVMAKEGMYEGGPGMDINLESMDVQGDIIADTAGALHSTYNYHKKKTTENGEEPKGVIGEVANKAGKIYQKSKKDILSNGRDITSYGEQGLDHIKNKYSDSVTEDETESLEDVFS